MPVKFEVLSDETQSLLNTIEGELTSIKYSLGASLATSETDEELRRKLYSLLEGKLKSLSSAVTGLKKPIILVELEHPCANCIVVRDHLDPSEHCEGCVNEMRQVNYVPTYLEATEASAEEDEETESYMDATECSAEEDDDEESLY